MKINPEYSIVEFTAVRFKSGDRVQSLSNYLWNGTDTWDNEIGGTKWANQMSDFDIVLAEDNFAIAEYRAVGNSAGIDGTMLHASLSAIGCQTFEGYDAELLAIAESILNQHPKDSVITFLTLWKTRVETYYVSEYAVTECDIISELLGTVDLEELAKEQND
jgi:hypothetical protein